ncbi:hypothetical protein L914_08716 [Phytophthora nicotianae]|uniref:Uncharacterized protein n=1 Tax=Phytophthora nicotianae TaxID=4792 RepID=W2NEP2_PHYNI|nr:hypothetical protein L914_08716 [Phytophthora nicotianae]
MVGQSDGPLVVLFVRGDLDWMRRLDHILKTRMQMKLDERARAYWFFLGLSVDDRRLLHFSRYSLLGVVSSLAFAVDEDHH